MSKARVHYEKAVSPIQIVQGHHVQIKMAMPTSIGKAKGKVTPQQLVQ